jgi:hypothetical protein
VNFTAAPLAATGGPFAASSVAMKTLGITWYAAETLRQQLSNKALI